MKPQAVAIVIPARNEESHIGPCLDAVCDALDQVASLQTIAVIVDNGSSDRTSQVAATKLAGRSHLVRCLTKANVGLARREGVALAIASFADLPLDRIWLAFTDADTLVPEDWICRQLTWAEAGATGVAGIVRLPSSDSASNAKYEALYAEGVWARGHRHIHGANMGVRASGYTQAGGFADLTVGEDTDLWRRLGARLVTDPGLVVETSARRRSRVSGGLATYLHQLATESVGAGVSID